MSKPTWLIVGATSIIAKEFAHVAARAGHPLILVARNAEHLATIAADIQLRFHVACEIMIVDFAADIKPFITSIQQSTIEMNLLIAYSITANNEAMTQDSLSELLNVNITATCQLIHAYWNKPQSSHKLLFLSSVAAARGRAKNSLYGASKAAIEVYLQGLQQSATKTQNITYARLGYIDTPTTYGMPGIFYASPPASCAKACWMAVKKKKRYIYHPCFWRIIMMIISNIPNKIYEKMRGI